MFHIVSFFYNKLFFIKIKKVNFCKKHNNYKITINNIFIFKFIGMILVFLFNPISIIFSFTL
jgi:hypothetical protein